jgi:hydrogenase expression/formation protein HypE
VALMKPGKLTPAELATIVFPRHGARRADVLVRAGIGRDAAVVDFGAESAVLSTDPITGAGHNAGWLAVQIGCNDVATAGAEPVGVLITLLLAPETALEDAQRIMTDAHRAAEELGVEIIGGHSEVTAGLPRSIAVVTALGRVARGRHVSADGARPGDTILLTKWAGLEGTAILARDFATPLARLLPVSVLARAQALIEQISVVPEALAAAAGASAMHDATEGGVLGALAELATASNVTLEVDLENVPVLSETRAVCSGFGIDPLGLVSSGALLIATPTPDAVIAAVESRGCPIARIGRAIAGPPAVRRASDGADVQPPARDALWDALDQGL